MIVQILAPTPTSLPDLSLKKIYAMAVVQHRRGNGGG